MIGLYKAKLVEDMMEGRGSTMIMLVAFLGLSCFRVSSVYLSSMFLGSSMCVLHASVILKTLIICSVLAQILLVCVIQSFIAEIK